MLEDLDKYGSKLSPREEMTDGDLVFNPDKVKPHLQSIPFEKLDNRKPFLLNQVSEKRFESFNALPQISSKNPKMACLVNLKKVTGRGDFAKEAM